MDIDADMNRENIGVSFEEVRKLQKGNLKPILAREKGEYFELNGELRGRKNLIPVYTDDYVGHKAYERTLSFILITAFHRVFKGIEVIIDHSISRGLYCWIRGRILTEEELSELEVEMRRIVKEDYPITKECMLIEDALEMFQKTGNMDNYLLLKEMPYREIKMYRLLDQYAYFYGKMAVSTGDIKLFSLTLYKHGFVMSYPTVKDPDVLKPFEPQDKLFEIFE